MERPTFHSLCEYLGAEDEPDLPLARRLCELACPKDRRRVLDLIVDVEWARARVRADAFHVARQV